MTVGEDNRTLSLAGAATRAKLDLDGDSNYTDPGEMDDTRLYNKANELQSRDVDTDSSVDYTLSHDAVGNLTDDGENNEYIYDAWGRLRFVNNQSQVPVSEYRYNGLNWRISVSHDTDSDDDIDDDDIIWYFVHDERWRIVAVYREADANPKEQFNYHAAGQNGIGTASYIDDVILRDRDATNDWEAAADDTLDERLHYCQNWRHDVVALIDAAGGGTQVEHQRYEAYGVPYLFVAGDVTANGTINAADTNQIQTWIDTSAYDPRGDIDLDNDVDATDKSLASANSGKGGGRENLTTHTGNRKGYAGYEFDDSIAHMSYQVRHRVLDSTLGEWTRRDPHESIGAAHPYAYVLGRSLALIDSTGLSSETIIAVETEDHGELNESRLQDFDWRPIISRDEAICQCCRWWWDNYADLSWASGLPNCPCQALGAPPGWSTDPGFVTRRYHPGASKCYRSPPIGNGANQQCCYDQNGVLITWGRAAGTPDKNRPRGHFPEDVHPFSRCDEVGLLSCYLEARPPDVVPCAHNPPNPLPWTPCACTPGNYVMRNPFCCTYSGFDGRLH